MPPHHSLFDYNINDNIVFHYCYHHKNLDRYRIYNLRMHYLFRYS